MTYSTHALDAFNTGSAAFTSEACAPVRHTRRRRHAHVMRRHSAGSRISGFGI